MEHKEKQKIHDAVHIVLRGPDGKVKDERFIQEDSNGTDEGHEIQEQDGIEGIHTS